MGEKMFCVFSKIESGGEAHHQKGGDGVSIREVLEIFVCDKALFGKDLGEIGKKPMQKFRKDHTDTKDAEKEHTPKKVMHGIVFSALAAVRGEKEVQKDQANGKSDDVIDGCHRGVIS